MTRLQVLTARAWVPDTLQARLKTWSPKSDLGKIVRECFKFLPPEQAATLLEAISSSLVIESSLSASAIRHPDNRVPGKLLDARQGRARDRLYALHTMRLHHLSLRDVDAADLLLPSIAMFSQQAGLLDAYGIVSHRLVTTAGVGFLVDSWQNILEPEIMKYHAIGTGSTAEATGDTALVTELTTQYNPDNTRATGSLTEGAGANIFRSVGTNTVDASATIAEHGLLSQAATGGGTLWDRSVLSPTSGLGNGDALQTTYDMQATAGG